MRPLLVLSCGLACAPAPSSRRCTPAWVGSWDPGCWSVVRKKIYSLCFGERRSCVSGRRHRIDGGPPFKATAATLRVHIAPTGAGNGDFRVHLARSARPQGGSRARRCGRVAGLLDAERLVATAAMDWKDALAGAVSGVTTRAARTTLHVV